MKKAKSKLSARASFLLEVDYDPKKTDPEGLATMLDMMFQYGWDFYNDCIDEYGDPVVSRDMFLPVQFRHGGNDQTLLVTVHNTLTELKKTLPPLTFSIEVNPSSVAMFALNNMGNPFAGVKITYCGDVITAAVNVAEQGITNHITLSSDVQAVRNTTKVVKRK